MASLFKYFSDQRFALALIERGEVFMQTLATFRGYDDADVRRDPDDGRLQYGPADGLPIRFDGRQAEDPWTGWRMTSSVIEEDIYAYCLSTRLSENLARRFESPFCVEIVNPIAFVGKIRRRVSLRSRLERKIVPFGPIDYRGLEAIPAADWALPEKVALMKPSGWNWQHEFRIVVGKKHAFDVQNVRMTLQAGPAPIAPLVDHPPLILTLGDLSRCTRLHGF